MTNISGESCSVPGANNRRLKDKFSKQWVICSGDCAPAMKYLASRSYNSSWAPVKFLDALFRGYGQVVFANNPISGILIFIGLTAANPVVSAAGLLTATVGLLVSIMMIPQKEEMIINGLTVFNPLLIGLITAGTLPAQHGIELEYWHFFLMIVAAIISVYVASGFGNILGSLSQFPLPYLTVPFNVVQQTLFIIIISTTQIHIKETSSVSQPYVNGGNLYMNSEHVPVLPSQLNSMKTTHSELSDFEDIHHGDASLTGVSLKTAESKQDFQKLEHLHSFIFSTESSTPDISFSVTSEIMPFSEPNNDPNRTVTHFRGERNTKVDNISSDISINSSPDIIELDWGKVFSGIVLSMSQVYAFNNAPAAILMYLAILIYSPIMAGFAVIGAAVGTISGMFITDANTYATVGGIYDGTWGFNSVLSTMCLGGMFFVLNWFSAITAIICSFFATLLMRVFMPSFSQVGLSPMSLPFNLSALLFLCVTSGTLVRPTDISFPEKHRHEYRQLQKAMVDETVEDETTCAVYGTDSKEQMKTDFADIV